MRIELEYRRGERGRPEGSLRVEGEPEARPFVGTMQLLRLLEDLTDESGPAKGLPSSAPKRTNEVAR